MFDYIIIGTGFAGSVIAERIANTLNKKVLEGLIFSRIFRLIDCHSSLLTIIKKVL
jgi:hypothetical protein